MRSHSHLVPGVAVFAKMHVPAKVVMAACGELFTVHYRVRIGLHERRTSVGLGVFRYPGCGARCFQLTKLG